LNAAGRAPNTWICSLPRFFTKYLEARKEEEEKGLNRKRERKKKRGREEEENIERAPIRPNGFLVRHRPSDRQVYNLPANAKKTKKTSLVCTSLDLFE
jgi:hypothetical protein